MESSGWGSRIIAPSFVVFLLVCCDCRRMERGGCTGNELWDVLAGAFRRPSGSLRFPVRRRTEPANVSAGFEQCCPIKLAHQALHEY